MHRIEYPCGCTYTISLMLTFREEKKERPYVFSAHDIYLCHQHTIPIIVDKIAEMEDDAKKDYDRNLSAIQQIRDYVPKKK